MNTEVKKEDLSHIGRARYNDNGNTAFVCPLKTAHMDSMLLKNILQCFGNEYRIIDSYERLDDDTDFHIGPYKVFITNLPWKYGIYPGMPIDDNDTGMEADIVVDSLDVLGDLVSAEDYCNRLDDILNGK